MSTATVRQLERSFFEELEMHLRDTLVRFGEALYAQAEECRQELAFALVDTGRRFSTSAASLQARLRHTGERLEVGAAEATREIGRTLAQAGERLDHGSGVRPLPRGVTGTEASRHHLPSEAQHPRDSKVA
jgi:hypothetical protein